MVITGQRPDGMTDEEWHDVCCLPESVRLQSINLWLNMRNHKPDSASDAPTAGISPPSNPSEYQPLPSLQDLIPLDATEQRGTPNIFLRSAVFSATQGKSRRSMRGELVPSQDGYEIRVTAVESLDQADLDIWLQAVHLARSNPLGSICVVKGYAFLKELGLAKGGNDYVWLKDSLRRLQNAVIEFKVGPQWIRFSPITQASGNDETKMITLQFDPLLLKLFIPDSWTALWWEERRALKRKPLALWLHGYYASHADPYPVKVETLMRLCGSKAKHKYQFKEMLKMAFNQLEKVAGIKAVFDGELIKIEKTPTPSQARHLLKKTQQKTRGK